MNLKKLALLFGLALIVVIGSAATRLAAAATILVDDDLGQCPTATFTTISGAVGAASPGDTIKVCAGTYTENVSITKSLTLQGAQAGVDARGRVASESVVIPAVAALPTFNVTFTGTLTVDGFSFSGSTALGVIMTGAPGPNNGMQIVNNRFSGYSQSAVFMNRGGSDITIDRNVMDGSNLTGTGQAIFASNTQLFPGLNITNDWIINNRGRYGIFSDGNHNFTESATRQALISGNLIDNNNQGMNLGSRSFGSFGVPTFPYAGTISNNVISNNVFDGIQGGVQHVLITTNQIKNNGRNGIGLSNIGSAGADRGAQNSAVTCNLITGNGFTMAGAGIFMSPLQPAGTQATNVINSNNIAGNSAGLNYTGTESVNAENNWWGSATGPTHPLNPGGTGDLIVNPAGTVDFVPFLTSLSGCAPVPDSDGDGVGDDVDNCPATANPGQEDADGDGIGDACDTCPFDAGNDADGDGICGDADNCPTISNAGQEDADGDGIGDACDTCPLDSANDADGDGICGNVDNCPTVFNPGQQNFDGDSQGDACDNDDDNDGVPDNQDACPNTPLGTPVSDTGCPRAVTANQCKNGGWQTLQRQNGTTFKNQGDCMQYVNTGK
jgi:thrombospondin type 3 repeat protein